MANWINKIKVKHLIEGFHDDKNTLLDVRDTLKKELERIPTVNEDIDYEKQAIIDELDTMDGDTEIFEMDNLLRDIYDWGDQEIANAFRSFKVCWIG
jgi:predicted Zn-dependent peptidase